MGNEVLPASSLDVSSSQQQQHSLECNRTPDQLDGSDFPAVSFFAWSTFFRSSDFSYFSNIIGNGLSHVNLSDWQPLQELWLDGHVDTQWDSSGNALSASAEGLVNEFTGWRQPSIPVTPGSGGSCSAAEQNYWGHSPVSEAGSISYNGISAVSEAAGNRSHGHRGLSPSPSPARGAAGSRRHRALSFSPARGAGNVRRRALSFSPGRGARSSSNGWPPLPPGPPSWWTDNTSNTSADCTDEEYCLDGWVHPVYSEVTPTRSPPSLHSFNSSLWAFFGYFLWDLIPWGPVSRDTFCWTRASLIFYTFRNHSFRCVVYEILLHFLLVDIFFFFCFEKNKGVFECIVQFSSVFHWREACWCTRDSELWSTTLLLFLFVPVIYNITAFKSLFF